MSKNIQLEFFIETREEKLQREVEEIKESINKIRKGQFAKIGDLKKKYDELYADFEMMKSAICKGRDVTQ